MHCGIPSILLTDSQNVLTASSTLNYLIILSVSSPMEQIILDTCISPLSLFNLVASLYLRYLSPQFSDLFGHEKSNSADLSNFVVAIFPICFFVFSILNIPLDQCCNF